MTIRPTRPWRIIRGAGGNYKDQRYTTKERRDAAAQRFADKDGTDVLTELWDESHPQDGLNRGWACDGHRAPSKDATDASGGPKIEILHERDPDSDCSIRVWVDGVEVDASNLYVDDVDPGRGYSRADWNENVQGTRDADTSPSFKAAALAAYDAGFDSEHVT